MGVLGVRTLALVTVVAAVGCSTSGDEGPDGSVVVFDGVTLSAIRVDGRGSATIRLNPLPFGAFDFSADGKRIVHDSGDGLYVANADGSDARRIAGQPAQKEFLNTEPSWSPDGDRVVFEQDGSIYTISRDGGEPAFLVRGSMPRWASDGRFVFLSGYDPSNRFADIVVMAADGGDRTTLASGDDFDISPDGKSLAYSGPGGIDPVASRRAVYVRPLDGGEGRRVTNNGYAPIWSPDGDYLAFTRITECGHAICSGRIFVMPVDGGDARPVSELIGDPGGAVAWIP